MFPGIRALRERLALSRVERDIGDRRKSGQFKHFGHFWDTGGVRDCSASAYCEDSCDAWGHRGLSYGKDFRDLGYSGDSRDFWDFGEFSAVGDFSLSYLVFTMGHLSRQIRLFPLGGVLGFEGK